MTTLPEEWPADSTADRLADLRRRQSAARHTGSAHAVASQHAKGKQTARERIDLLLDPGSFAELDAFARHRSTQFGMQRDRPYGDGVVTGHGTVDGRPVCVFAQDFTTFGGSLGEVLGEKIVKVMDFAESAGCPVIGMNDSAGGRIQEGVAAQAAYGEIFTRNVRLSGVVPQLSLILGPCAGGAVYSPALTDFVVMVDRTSHMFITGPEVLRAVTGELVDFEQLGGARTHNTRSGNAHYLGADEHDAVAYTRRLLTHLPSNNRAEPPRREVRPPVGGAEQLDTIVPDDPDLPYDMRAVLTQVLDDGELLEVQALFAQNIIVGFGHVDGHSVGVVGNQPTHLAGSLDAAAAEKAARFVRTCDAFNVPLLTFVDTPGVRSPRGLEHDTIRAAAKLIHAYAEATTPMVTVVTRHARGDAYSIMGAKHLGVDVNLAWPTARITVTGKSAATALPDDCTPYAAAERGYLDAVIAPSDTPVQLRRALSLLRNKRAIQLPKKHDNIPL